MWQLLLIFIAIVILIALFAAKGSGSNSVQYMFSVDTSMDNAYRAITKYSKYGLGSPNISQSGIIKLMQIVDNIDDSQGSVILTVNIHQVSETRCSIVVLAGNMQSMQKINPSPYAKDIVDSIRKAYYKIH